MVSTPASGRPRSGRLRLASGLLALALPLGAAATGAPAQAVTEAEPPDNGAVRSLWSALDAAWDARDAERFADLFTADASFELVGRGGPMESRAAILRHFSETFPQLPTELRHRTAVSGIHVLAPDIRGVDARVEILRIGADSGGEPTSLRTFAVFGAMLRTPDGWRIRVLRAFQLPLAAAGPENPGVTR
jgi:uncharacterized protein (TIGR02246 family)